MTTVALAIAVVVAAVMVATSTDALHHAGTSQDHLLHAALAQTMITVDDRLHGIWTPMFLPPPAGTTVIVHQDPLIAEVVFLREADQHQGIAPRHPMDEILAQGISGGGDLHRHGDGVHLHLLADAQLPAADAVALVLMTAAQRSDLATMVDLAGDTAHHRDRDRLRGDAEGTGIKIEDQENEAPLPLPIE